MRSLLMFLLLLGTAVECLADADEPRRSMRYVTGNANETREWQARLRGALFERLRMTDWSARPALEPQRLSLEAREGYTLETLRVRATATRNITLMLARPTGSAGKAPGLVAIHGHGGTALTPFDPKETIYKDFGSALARAGFVVAAPSVGQHEVGEPGRLLMGERLWDAMRCVDLLASLPEVEGGRIGCAGLSLGGEMAMWLGAMDTRVAATASCGFLTFMDHMETNHCMCWKFDGLRALADFPDIYALIAPRPLQCQNGLKEPPDQFQVPLAQKAFAEIQPAYQALDAPGNVELCVHPGAHEIDLPELTRFLKRHLMPEQAR